MVTKFTCLNKDANYAKDINTDAKNKNKREGRGRCLRVPRPAGRVVMIRDGSVGRGEKICCLKKGRKKGHLHNQPLVVGKSSKSSSWRRSNTQPGEKVSHHRRKSPPLPCASAWAFRARPPQPRGRGCGVGAAGSLSGPRAPPRRLPASWRRSSRGGGASDSDILHEAGRVGSRA
uniref:Uncharacterized protein n=1 Tax=Myotis myotis TaxID=51298 RepID=A0A7J7TJU5_MYOMY|nr:hypothetical protein mMyoMyo1_009090 [Myotis myotis]